jgi:hypothetical protein
MVKFYDLFALVNFKGCVKNVM